jgi:hypothetical protein
MQLAMAMCRTKDLDPVSYTSCNRRPITDWFSKWRHLLDRHTAFVLNADETILSPNDSRWLKWSVHTMQHFTAMFTISESSAVFRPVFILPGGDISMLFYTGSVVPEIQIVDSLKWTECPKMAPFGSDDPLFHQMQFDVVWHSKPMARNAAVHLGPSLALALAIQPGAKAMVWSRWGEAKGNDLADATVVFAPELMEGITQTWPKWQLPRMRRRPPILWLSSHQRGMCCRSKQLRGDHAADQPTELFQDEVSGAVKYWGEDRENWSKSRFRTTEKPVWDHWMVTIGPSELCDEKWSIAQWCWTFRMLSPGGDRSRRKHSAHCERNMEKLRCESLL